MEFLLVFITLSKDLLLTAAFYCIFFALGDIFLHFLKLQVKGIHSVYVQPILGILVFGLVSYTLAWGKMQIFLLPLLGILLVLCYTKKYLRVPKIKITSKVNVGIVIVLAIIFSLNMTGIGVYGTSVAFRREDLVHLAYIQELKSNFPPDNPGFAGVALKGYHFFYQFIIASISRAFYVSIETLYFHVMPLIVSFTWAFGVYGLVLLWSKKRAAALWATFFSLFGGSFGFLLIFYGFAKGISIDSVFGIGQPTVALINPQFAFSVPVIITAFYFIHEYFREKTYKYLIPIALCAGLLPLIKVYGGIVFYPAFGVLVLVDFLQKRFTSILFFVASVGLSLLTFGLFLGANQRLIYAPLWPPHTVMESNLPWYGYTEKSYTYTRLGVIKGIIEIESFGLMLYFIGNLGVRFFGIVIAFLVLIFTRRRPSAFSLTLVASTITSIGIPLFFIQTGKVFETIQFAWYYPIFCSFFAGIGFADFFSLKFPKVIKIVLVLALIIFALPPAYNHYKAIFSEMLTLRQSVSSSYFKGVEYLAGVGKYNDTVLELPVSSWDVEKIGEWFYKSTPHITAFGNKRTYLNYEFIVFNNVRPNTRFPLISEVLKVATGHKIQTPKTIANLARSLKSAGIVYIYSPSPLPRLVEFGIVKKVFNSKIVTIYKVK